MAQTTALRVAAARNGRAVACAEDATAFLLSRPRGAYTGARTVRRARVLDFEGHMRRLVESTVAMQAAPVATSEVERVLRPRAEQTMRAAMKDFKDRFGSAEGEEYKINLLVCAPEGEQGGAQIEDTDVYCHIGLLPPLRSGLVKLKVAGLPRHNAAAKDSAWVRERKAIYDSLPKDVEEIVLMDPTTHELLEGSQTNFYSIQDGAVHTANDGILNGTIRALVLDVCAKNDIPVVFSPPNLEQVDSWESCFISSTSRLVLGASELQFEDLASKQPVTKLFPPSKLLERISSLVRAAILDKSPVVFEE